MAVVWWIKAGCLLVKERWSHLKTTWALMEIGQASETSYSKSRLGNFHHQYLPEFLVYVYRYCLMVKSVFWYCVHGRQTFTNPATSLQSTPAKIGNKSCGCARELFFCIHLEPTYNSSQYRMVHRDFFYWFKLVTCLFTVYWESYFLFQIQIFKPGARQPQANIPLVS